MRKKLFIKNTIILTTASLINKSIGIVFRVYLSKRVGAVGLGIYQLILEIYAFTVVLTASGISLAVIRLVIDSMTREKGENVRKIVATCILLSVTIGTIVGLFLFAGSDFIGRKILCEDRTSMSLKVLSLSLPFVAISACFRGFFYATKKVIISSCEQVLEQIMEICVFSLLINLFSTNDPELACTMIVTGTVLAEMFSCVYSVVMYKIIVKDLSLRSSSGKANFRSIFSISAPFTATSCIRSGLNTLENTLIPIGLKKYGSLPDRSLNDYGQINGMILPLISFPGTILVCIALLLISEISEAQALRNEKFIKKASSLIIKMTLLFSIAVAIILFFYGQTIVKKVYHSLSCSIYIKILAPIVPLEYMNTMIDGLLKGLNEQKKQFVCNTFDAIIRVSLIFFLVPATGIRGVIITMFTSAIFMSILNLYGIFIKKNQAKSYCSFTR